MENTKPRVLDYGQYGDDERSRTTTLVVGSKLIGTTLRTYHLQHRTEGYQPSGSRAVLVSEAYGVTFECDGAGNGRWCKTLEEAQGLFDAWTAPDA